MANPRKFSEKIALHNQKQLEETAAFEQIMREVIGATRVRLYSYLLSIFYFIYYLFVICLYFFYILFFIIFFYYYLFLDFIYFTLDSTLIIIHLLFFYFINR
jgi:hypothetical protein